MINEGDGGGKKERLELLMAQLLRETTPGFVYQWIPRCYPHWSPQTTDSPERATDVVDNEGKQSSRGIEREEVARVVEENRLSMGKGDEEQSKIRAGRQRYPHFP